MSVQCWYLSQWAMLVLCHQRNSCTWIYTNTYSQYTPLLWAETGLTTRSCYTNTIKTPCLEHCWHWQYENKSYLWRMRLKLPSFCDLYLHHLIYEHHQEAWWHQSRFLSENKRYNLLTTIIWLINTIKLRVSQ